MSAESDSAAERKTEVIPEWKREEVAALTELIGEYESVGVVDVSGIASRQLQQMRAELHGTAQLRMGRNTLVKRALDDVDEGLEALEEYVSGQVGLIGTDDNPFGLFRQLEASKTPAPISGGEVSPKEIVIPEGDTGMDPGPFVGELQSVGAAAQIMDGSIKVTADSVVAEAGDVVSDELASVLAEMGIEPKEVGLDLRAVYSDGVLFEAEELAIDVDEYRADFSAAIARGRSLSIGAEYPTGQTVSALLAKASAEAKSVGLAAEVESPDLVGDLVSRADSQVRALAAAIDDPDALPEDLLEAAASQAPAETEAETETDEPADEETEAEDAEADASDDADDDDDDDAGGDALGAMFG